METDGPDSVEPTGSHTAAQPQFMDNPRYDPAAMPYGHEQQGQVLRALGRRKVLFIVAGGATVIFAFVIGANL